MELNLPAATEQQLKEFVNVSQLGRLFIKEPERKFTDQFKGFIKTIISAVILLIIQFILLRPGRYTGFMYVLIGITILMLFLSIFSLLSMHKRLKYMLSNTGPSVLRLTPVELEHVSPKGDKIIVQWANVSFARIFTEMIVFFPNGPEGIIIGVDAGYAPQILDYMHANNINIRLIAGEKK